MYRKKLLYYGLGQWSEMLSHWCDLHYTSNAAIGDGFDFALPKRLVKIPQIGNVITEIIEIGGANPWIVENLVSTVLLAKSTI
jgi:UDP-3-O-[3-hydroxymyristoyl] glucosamine N-acyltransferase